VNGYTGRFDQRSLFIGDRFVYKQYVSLRQLDELREAPLGTLPDKAAVLTVCEAALLAFDTAMAWKERHPYNPVTDVHSVYVSTNFHDITGKLMAQNNRVMIDRYFAGDPMHIRATDPCGSDTHKDFPTLDLRKVTVFDLEIPVLV
jgi:hypothetical protein